VRTKVRALLILLMTLILIPAQALAQEPKASIDWELLGIKDFWGVTNVGLGKKIQLKVKVSVAQDSPVDLDGFWIETIFKKPDGTTTDADWFGFTDEYIRKGESKSYILKTSVKADQLGTWTAFVLLWDKDKRPLAYDQKNFEVVELPVASITIEEIAGYAALAGLIAAGAYLARR